MGSFLEEPEVGMRRKGHVVSCSPVQTVTGLGSEVLLFPFSPSGSVDLLFFIVKKEGGQFGIGVLSPKFPHGR